MPLSRYARDGMEDQAREEIIRAVVEQMASEFDPLSARAQRERVRARAAEALSMVASAMGIFIPTAQRLDIIEAVVSRIAGYGFLDELLPPRRSDLIEIAINPDGSVWALRKCLNRTSVGLKLQHVHVWLGRTPAASIEPAWD